MTEFLIPRTIPKFAGTPVTALDLDDLRYLLRHARPDRLFAIEREFARRAPRVRTQRRPPVRHRLTHRFPALPAHQRCGAPECILQRLRDDDPPPSALDGFHPRWPHLLSGYTKI